MALRYAPMNVVGKEAAGTRPLKPKSAAEIAERGKENKTAVPKIFQGGLKDNKPTIKRDKIQVSEDKVEQVPVHAVEPVQKTVESLTQAFSTQNIGGVQDIDAEDAGNPQLVSEYVADIYQYMRELETEQNIRCNFLSAHPGNGTSPRMRAILVDWIIQVHMRFRLLQETLYLSIAVLDRYLQEKCVSKSHLQLVGVSAMFVASKYEEMYAPEIGDFVYITDNSFSKAEIRAMERSILKTLGFKLGRPLPLHFLRRNSKAGEAHVMSHTLAKYLMELTLSEYDCAHYNPSLLAAASLCLTMKILDNDPWNETLVHHSGYTEKDLLPVMQKLAVIVTKAETSKLQAVRGKYASPKFMRISMIPELKSSVIKNLAAAASSNGSNKPAS